MTVIALMMLVGFTALPSRVRADVSADVAAPRFGVETFYVPKSISSITLKDGSRIVLPRHRTYDVSLSVWRSQAQFTDFLNRYRVLPGVFVFRIAPIDPRMADSAYEDDVLPGDTLTVIEKLPVSTRMRRLEGMFPEFREITKIGPGLEDRLPPHYDAAMSTVVLPLPTFPRYPTTYEIFDEYP